MSFGVLTVDTKSSRLSTSRRANYHVSEMLSIEQALRELRNFHATPLNVNVRS